ncbi:MAG TPA: 50S ribosomal protein L32 [Candidatus Paceibacterota bacterium]
MWDLNKRQYRDWDVGVPRAHSTRGQKGRRRSHLALKKLGLVACNQCRKLKLPHAVCPSCGFYKGEEKINVLAKELKKKEKHKKK